MLTIFARDAHLATLPVPRAMQTRWSAAPTQPASVGDVSLNTVSLNTVSLSTRLSAAAVGAAVAPHAGAVAPVAGAVAPFGATAVAAEARPMTNSVQADLRTRGYDKSMFRTSSPPV